VGQPDDRTSGLGEPEAPDWFGTTRSPHALLCCDFPLGTRILGGLALEASEVLSSIASERCATRFIYSSPESRATRRVVIHLYEADSVTHAHRVLLDLLAHHMAPRPRCSAEGLELGDVCFGTEDGSRTAVLFASYNLVVDVRSVGIERRGVTDFAARIDDQIRAETQVEAPKGESDIPVVEVLVVPSEPLRREEPVELEFGVVDPKNRGFTLKIVATGGTLERHDHTYAYTPRESGQQTLRVIATNPEGSGTQAEATVRVE
jgi:hypothetical protein